MKPKRSCSNCIKGTSISINNDILCREKGVVSQDYVCLRHRFMPEPRNIKGENKCIDCEYFIVEVYNPSGVSSFGLCQLLTYRQYDGSKKNACSKFIKKSGQEVS